MRDVVYKRIAGLISRREFKDALRTPLEEGGIGFTIAASRKLTRYFEKIIIQGIDAKGHH
jgi:hypothetical protein